MQQRVSPTSAPPGEAAEAASGSSAPAESTDADNRIAVTASSIQKIFAPVQADFDQLNTLIPQLLTSDVTLVEEISAYIVSAGGKRLRPLLVLLAAHNLKVEPPGDDRFVRLAAVIELLHTATLLHDDVVDKSALRRGRATANATWGNAPTVLVGDFLYSRAFQLMAGLENSAIISILADATNVIAQGEVMQLSNVGNAELTEPAYGEVIRCKTAMLFEAAAHSAAILAEATPEEVEQVRRFGAQFGLAYQLVDDVLDYTGDAETMGKNVGDDLSEGKMTLPLIHTVRTGSSADADLVRQAIEQRSAAELEPVICAVNRSGGVEYTRARAMEHAQQAISTLADLPQNEYQSSMHSLALLAVERVA